MDASQNPEKSRPTAPAGNRQRRQVSSQRRHAELHSGAGRQTGASIRVQWLSAIVAVLALLVSLGSLFYARSGVRTAERSLSVNQSNRVEDRAGAQLDRARSVFASYEPAGGSAGDFEQIVVFNGGAQPILDVVIVDGTSAGGERRWDAHHTAVRIDGLLAGQSQRRPGRWINGTTPSPPPFAEYGGLQYTLEWTDASGQRWRRRVTRHPNASDVFSAGAGGAQQGARSVERPAAAEPSYGCQGLRGLGPTAAADALRGEAEGAAAGDTKGGVTGLGLALRA